MAKIAQKYLSAPLSSVASEQQFSGAGDVYDDKHNKLAPEKLEMLLLMKVLVQIFHCNKLFDLFLLK